MITHPAFLFGIGTVLVGIFAQVAAPEGEGLIANEIEGYIILAVQAAVLVLLQQLTVRLNKTRSELEVNSEKTSEIHAQIQTETSLKLEVEMYRRAFARMRENPACASCRALLATALQSEAIQAPGLREQLMAEGIGTQPLSPSVTNDDRDA